MPIEDLLRTIESLRGKARKFEALLSTSEALTRYALIDPFLRALGWDTENPEQVRPEFPTGEGRPDYALLKKITENDQETLKPHIFVGAKPLGKPEDLAKQIAYCVDQGVPYFAATDGVRWTLYDTFKPVPTPDKKRSDWDILNMDVGEVARRALALYRLAPIGYPAPEPLMAPERPVRVPIIHPLTRQEMQQMQDGQVLVCPSKPDGVQFFNRFQAWGFLRALRRIPRYVALYVTAPESAVRFLAEVERIADQGTAPAEIRDAYPGDTWPKGKRVLVFKGDGIWELASPIPLGMQRKKAPRGPFGCSLSQLARAASLDDL